ncbi:MAG: ParB N-terminal domain-containing protein [Christensenella sp.]
MAFKLNPDITSNINRVADSALRLDAQSSFRIEYVDLNKIVPSEKNFYRIDEIEELAEDIELNGLMHNLVLRKLENDTYEIISGERRFSAYKLLNEKLGDKYRMIPAKVDTADDLDAEEKLIRANQSTRVCSPAETFQAVERLTQIYTEKKARGDKIPGRIREAISNELSISQAQVSRYQKIADSLSPAAKQDFIEGNINMSDALNISSSPNVAAQADRLNEVKEKKAQAKSETANPIGTEKPKRVKYEYFCPKCGVQVWAYQNVVLKCESCQIMLSVLNIK